MTSPVVFTGTGTHTVEVGPAPARANGIDVQLVCLSAGTFTVTPGGTSITCSGSDVGNPRGSSITYPYAMPLAHGQHSLTVTTAAGVSWRLTARYAVVSDTPWGMNASGQTYGTLNDKGAPDLIAVSIKGGTGYAYSSEFGPYSFPQPANPTQALEWQQTPLVTVHVPVYLSDGKTRIGELDEQVHEAYVQAAATQCASSKPTGPPQLALIPNVTGMDVNAADKVLKAAGFSRDRRRRHSELEHAGHGRR